MANSFEVQLSLTKGREQGDLLTQVYTSSKPGTCIYRVSQTRIHKTSVSQAVPVPAAEATVLQQQVFFLEVDFATTVKMAAVV